MGKLIALCGISIHALREEGDRYPSHLASFSVAFLSTPSARRATISIFGSAMDDIFLSTPSARRATSRGERYGCGRGISIHALREEGDQSCTLNLPCYERFLSTPSARRATTDARRWHTIMDISIHALREEGDGDRFLLRHIAGISIHALREEGDLS